MKLELTKEVRERMMSCLVSARRREVGGILMAEQVEPGNFRIVDFSIDDVTGSAAHFVRSTEHHRHALESFFARTGNDYSRFNYLGEWHSHPNHAPIPSSTDVDSMRELLREERNISFAVLLIIKRNWRGRLLCSATLFNKVENQSDIQIVTKP
jgi:[CysO sulfur-carrier protein]-S-L-cysteine hydrolase